MSWFWSKSPNDFSLKIVRSFSLSQAEAFRRVMLGSDQSSVLSEAASKLLYHKVQKFSERTACIVPGPKSEERPTAEMFAEAQARIDAGDPTGKVDYAALARKQTVLNTPPPPALSSEDFAAADAALAQLKKRQSEPAAKSEVC